MSRKLINTIFRFFMAIYVFFYRLTGGKVGGRVQGRPVLLLTTTGRKTGKRRTTPLGYFAYDGSYAVTASNAGFHTHPAWFFNLRSNPQVSVQIKEKQLTATAETAEPELREQLWAKLMELAPSYANYQKRTTREIPIVILRPVSKT